MQFQGGKYYLKVSQIPGWGMNYSACHPVPKTNVTFHSRDRVLHPTPLNRGGAPFLVHLLSSRRQTGIWGSSIHFVLCSPAAFFDARRMMAWPEIRLTVPTARKSKK